MVRETLTRQWDATLPILLFVMLNPSTATQHKNDPTIRKCIRFAELHGYGGITVVNLFSFRATKPADLRIAGYPVGLNDDDVIRRAAIEHPKAICAWGAQARACRSRVAEVVEILESENCQLNALRTLPDNTPAHPLMLPYTCRMHRWWLQ